MDIADAQSRIEPTVSRLLPEISAKQVLEHLKSQREPSSPLPGVCTSPQRLALRLTMFSSFNRVKSPIKDQCELAGSSNGAVNNRVEYAVMYKIQSHFKVQRFKLVLPPLISPAAKGQFWCHCSPPGSPIQPPRGHRVAAKEWGGGPRGHHGHRGSACPLRCCQGRPAVSATATRAQLQVRESRM